MDTESDRDEQVDNASLAEKLVWRREALRLVGRDRCIAECYGGWGVIGSALYRDVEHGVVYEKHGAKTAALSKARPRWAVYEGDAVRLAAIGAGRHRAVTLLDVDPYGSPWPVLRAWFGSPRPHPARLVVVAHDGTARVVKMGRAWSVKELEAVVAQFGNTVVKERYGDVSEVVLGDIVAPQGYRVTTWRYQQGGDRGKSGHWLAVVER